MRFYVPQIKDQIVLTSDWSFHLHNEYRNAKLLDVVDPNGYDYSDPVVVTFPTGMVLRVERIYIRQNAPDYSSITFRVVKSPDNPAFLKARFWVKLDDANKIEFDKE